jgi:hypothetical protein
LRRISNTRVSRSIPKPVESSRDVAEKIRDRAILLGSDDLD